MQKKLDSEKQRITNEVIASIDLTGEKIDRNKAEEIADVVLGKIVINWKSLIDKVTPSIEFSAHDSIKLVAAEIEVISTKDALKLMFTEARDWAKERAADLVGMKKVDGKFVPNPNAAYAIDEATRGFIRADVVNAIEQGLSTQELAKTLQENYAFSEVRSEAIARTETAFASMQGALISYRETEARGIEMFKSWSTVGDDKVSSECLENEAEGIIPMGQLFKNGEDAPPQHVNCRCGIIPYAGEIDATNY